MCVPIRTFYFEKHSDWKAWYGVTKPKESAKYWLILRDNLCFLCVINLVFISSYFVKNVNLLKAFTPFLHHCNAFRLLHCIYVIYRYLSPSKNVWSSSEKFLKVDFWYFLEWTNNSWQLLPLCKSFDIFISNSWPTQSEVILEIGLLCAFKKNQLLLGHSVNFFYDSENRFFIFWALYLIANIKPSNFF